MRQTAGLIIGVLVFGLGFGATASASMFTGSYSYGLTGETSQPSCTSASPEGGNPWTDNFASTSGGNSISSAPVTFSICDGTPGYLEEGVFLISGGGGNSAAGIFSGTLTGNTLPNNTGGDIFNGAFIITSALGTYASLGGAVGNFEVVTGAVNTAAFATGTISFQQTPEPVTPLLCGSGLVALGFLRKFLKRSGDRVV